MISTGKAAKQPNSVAKSNLINKGGTKPQQPARPSKPVQMSQSTPISTPKVSLSNSK